MLGQHLPPPTTAPELGAAAPEVVAPEEEAEADAELEANPTVVPEVEDVVLEAETAAVVEALAADVIERSRR